MVRPLRGHGDRDLRVVILDPDIPQLEEGHRKAGREGGVVHAPVEGRDLALGRELLRDQLEALFQLDALQTVSGEIPDRGPSLSDLALQAKRDKNPITLYNTLERTARQYHEKYPRLPRALEACKKAILERGAASHQFVELLRRVVE